ncbi:hypothetical protein [Kribbella sp. NBC_00889]|uniref:hypothetical protein n=1 Tax=Kribbella sp. NBC_00889 TaxID=2975974 RepID=UPI003866E207|nr:hypothetical protein OG817_00005 [Kribbella sp. NBC_00889]
MTDAVQGGMEWVPRFGMLEVPRRRAELIRGLFEVAAWVADHPELPMPWVSAVMIPCETSFQRDIRVVGDVAEALGVASAFAADGAYVAQRRFGPVQVKCIVRPVPHGVGAQAPASEAGWRDERERTAGSGVADA